MYSKHRESTWLNRLMNHHNFDYIVFLGLMIWKLWYFHAHLHARNIDMNPLDFMIAIGSVMLISFWTLWLPSRGKRISLIIVDLLLTGLMYSDLVYYRYFQDFITVPVLLQAGQVGELGDSIRSLIHGTDLLFIPEWIFLILLLGFRVIRRQRRSTDYPRQLSLPKPRDTRSPKWLKRFSSSVIALVIGFLLTMGPIKFYQADAAVGLFTGNWWTLSLYNVTGLLGFHYYDVQRYAKDHLGSKVELTQDQKTEIQEWFKQAGKTRNVKNDAFGAYKGSNVLVIQTESMMNFVIGQSIGGQEITPNFNRLMKESMYFTNYYHQTGQGRTSDADFTSNASLHPLPSGSVFTRYADHQYDVLPAILKENGYHAYVFHGYDSSFWNRLSMYKNMGYDRFYNKKDFQLDEKVGWSLGDKSFFRQTLNYLKKEPQPFYSFMITLSSHHPYTLPENVQTLDIGEYEGTSFGDYLESIHYVDEALGQLIDGLKAEGLWDSTILYIYGDHDSAIKDKELYEKLLGKSLNELDMHQIMNQVPLMIHLPDGKRAGKYEEAEGQLDMTPSLLHLLGISSEPYYMMGNNIFDGRRHLVVLHSGAFTDGKVYYIPSDDRVFENGTCYNLSTRHKDKVEMCRENYKEAKKRLDFSSKTITYNLIQEFEQTQKPQQSKVEE